MLKVLGRLQFIGNTKLNDSEVATYFPEHKVDCDQYRQLSSSWKNHKGFCIGWRFRTVEVYDPPFWVPWTGAPWLALLPVG